MTTLEMRISLARLGPLFDRFTDKICVEPGGCWRWTAASSGRTETSRYGRFNVAGRTAKAHRLAYEAAVGQIPPGLTIDHLCRNTLCVNPNHLEVVTHRENILRGEGVAAVHARKESCVRGHPFSHENTYVEPNSSRRCKICKRANQRFHRAERRRLVAEHRHDQPCTNDAPQKELKST